MNVKVGTSSWNYESFRRDLYVGAPRARFLAIYVKHFDTVELNASFILKLSRKDLGGMVRKGSRGFYLGCKNELIYPFQQPPTLSYDRGLFKSFFDKLRRNGQNTLAALNTRHESWHSQEVFDFS